MKISSVDSDHWKERQSNLAVSRTFTPRAESTHGRLARCRLAWNGPDRGGIVVFGTMPRRIGGLRRGAPAACRKPTGCKLVGIGWEQIIIAVSAILGRLPLLVA